MPTSADIKWYQSWPTKFQNPCAIHYEQQKSELPLVLQGFGIKEPGPT